MEDGMSTTIATTRRRRPRGSDLRLTALAILAIPLAAVRLSAQPELGLFTDTVEVEVVNVEVTVTDAEGRPVKGLERDDFEIYENGRQVEISHFFAVEERQVAGRGEAIADDLPAGGSDGIAGPETRRLNLVVVVDNLNIRPENRNLLFADLREYVLENLHPEDRVMLVTLGSSMEMALPFTNDRQQLLETLDRLSRQVGRFVQYDAEHRQLLQRLQRASLVNRDDGPGQLNSLAGDSGADWEEALLTAERLAQEIRVVAERRYQRVQATARVLGGFTESLAGLPGRKAVLYLSDGLPLRAAESLVEAWIGKYEGWIVTNQQQRLLQEVTLLNSLEMDAGREISELVEQAAANGVVFYPITPAGRSAPVGISAEFGGSRVTTGGGPLSAGVAQLETSSREASLLALADGTGGVALTHTTNLGELLARLTRDFQTFYSLGYQPPEGSEEEFRQIEVRLRREDLRVRHLSGYRKKGPEERLEERTLAALHYGTEAGNRLDLTLDPQAVEKTGKDRYRVPVMVKIPFERLLLLPEEEHHSARVTLIVVAGDSEGRVSPLQRIELPVQIPNERILEAATQVMAYPMELEMRGGRQRIAVGALDRLARVEATAAVEIEVGATAGREGSPASR